MSVPTPPSTWPIAPELAKFKQQRAKHLDALSTALTLAEQAINEQEFRVPGVVALWAEDDDGHEVRHYLEYSREDDGWGLYVTTYYDEDEEPHSSVRLSKAPREFRMRAADVLDELWAALLLRASEEDDRVRTKAERAADFVARITGKQVP